MTQFTPNAGMFPAQPMGGAAPMFGVGPSASAVISSRRRTRLGDKYLAALCLVLLGYALGGRGFAYWGVNPLFIGEIMLMVGVYVTFRTGMLAKILRVRLFVPLILFMFWGACCTIPYIDKYQKDAIRDAVVWGYGTFAFIVAGLLISNPQRIKKLVLYGQKFCVWYLLLAPIFCLASSTFDTSIPPFPGSDVPLIQTKGGDMCVHVGGAFAYIVALGGRINPWIPSLFIPLNLGLNIQGRAGMVSFCAACAIVMLLRPFHARAMRIFIVIGIGLFLLWASDLHFEKGAREISFDFLTQAFQSIVKDSDNEAIQGSKEWRKKWWTDIYNYTFQGPYFWTGKGFGINLADDDGYQVDVEGALRSPHSGHMTMLARGGVPMLTIWLITQLTFAWSIVKCYLMSRRRAHKNWSGWFLFLGAYWAAFMANTSFDVFIEGPMGGIWLWCIYGAGIGSVYLYKRYPELLTPEPAAAPVMY